MYGNLSSWRELALHFFYPARTGSRFVKGLDLAEKC
jgi:hypothetical protein